MSSTLPHRARFRLVLIAPVLWCAMAAPCLSAETFSFESQIAPLLSEKCYDCHGPDEQQSLLRVDQRASLLRGGNSGEAAITPNQSDRSLLIELVSGRDPKRQMPPDGPPLSPAEIELLSKWIDQGAIWPGQMDTSDDKIQSDHWSLQPLSQPQVPSNVGNHPIDAFIAKRLQDAGLAVSPPADAITLARRAAIVITGLPPTQEQVEALHASDLGYEKLVDDLLTSPRYGERWAQHWLDVIRWAETVGFETNQERRQAWPYRDWVIDALNDDVPYDQFIRHQILGDQLNSDAALGFLVAGPANLPGQIGRDEEAMRQARQDELDEVIQTVSQSLMGLTVGCARCHNHKFDPLLQKDYYSMQAIFAGLSYGDRRWRGEQNDQMAAQIPSNRAKLQTLQSKLETLRQEHQLRPALETFPSETFDAVLATAVRMEIAATNDKRPASLYELQAWSQESNEQASRNIASASAGGRASASSFALANQTRHYNNLIDGSVDRRQAFPWVAETAGPAWVQVDFDKPTLIDRIAWDTSSGVPVDFVVNARDAKSNEWITVATSHDRVPRIDDTRPSKDIRIADLSEQQVAELLGVARQIRQTQSTLQRLNAGPRVYAASFKDNPATTFQLRRGDPMQKIAAVAPSTPVVLGSLPLDIDAPEIDRRQAFVDQLTSPDNPLTARVIVNRVWQHHFGIGLVDTPSDLGKMGSPPSHPELLDWLANELIGHDWSLKHLHRLIVTSKTFQQASTPNEVALQIDADSRLLWRFPPRRIEAESIRDSILAASGKLNLKMGGRGFDFFRQRGGLSDYQPIETFDESGWRRMVYAHKIRMQSVDVFGTFDCPDAGQMKPRRTQSITPLQSLSLLNSPFVIRQAGFFAERIRSDVGDDPDNQIDRALQIAYSRRATQRERMQLLPLVSSEGLTQLCRVLFNTSEFLYLR